jgi:hypothetical protein
VTEALALISRLLGVYLRSPIIERFFRRGAGRSNLPKTPFCGMYDPPPISLSFLVCLLPDWRRFIQNSEDRADSRLETRIGLMSLTDQIHSYVRHDFSSR